MEKPALAQNLPSSKTPSSESNLASSKRLSAFTVIARNLSKENKYVKSVMLNGKPLDAPILRHADIMRGGELVFEMVATP